MPSAGYGTRSVPATLEGRKLFFSRSLAYPRQVVRAADGPRRSSVSWFSAAFLQRYDLIDFEVLEDLDIAADPTDFDTLDTIAPTKAEVEPRAVVALVAPAAVDFVDLDQIPGDDLDVRPRAIAP